MMLDLADHDDIVGFFSYSRDDDEDSEDALSRLRMRIQNELRAQMGRSRENLRLWQDREAISAGTLWEGEIDHAVESSLFFIPIVTPRVVRSKYCRVEFEKFLAREQELARNDLIFPILYIGVSELENERAWRDDPVLRVIGERQYVDWRAFRHEPDSVALRVAIEKFCKSIVAALERRSFKAPRERRDDGAARTRADISDATAATQVRPGWQSAFFDLMSGADRSPLHSAVLIFIVGAASGLVSYYTFGLIAVDVDKEVKTGLFPALVYSLSLCFMLYRVSRSASIRMLFVFPLVSIGWVIAEISAAHLAFYLKSAKLFADQAAEGQGPILRWQELAIGGLAGGLIGGSFVILAITLALRGPADLRTAVYGLIFAAAAGLLLCVHPLALLVVWQGGVSALIAYCLMLVRPGRNR